MERNDEKEPCTSTSIPNEKISVSKVDFNDIEEVTVKKIEKKDVYVDDEDGDVDIDEENQIMPANMCLLAENTLCDKKEDEWLIDEDSDHSIESDLGISLSSNESNEDKNTNSKSLGLITQKIKDSTFGSKINESISNAKQTKEESDLSSPIMIKHLQHLTNSTLNNLYRPPSSNIIPGSSSSTSKPSPLCSTNLTGPSYSSSIPNPSCSINLPGPSSATSLPDSSCSVNLPGPSCSTSLPGSSYSASLPDPSCSTSLPGPSCSTSLPDPSCSASVLDPSCSTSLAGPSCSTGLPDLSPFSAHQAASFFDENIDPNVDNKQQARLLQHFYNTLFLNNCDKQKNTELNQDIEISNLEDCDFSKHYLSENTSFKNTDEESETENTECFVEDPDIVNPDIMYNIDLNEYYNQLDLLALKVIKTPDDPTGLVEYKQLPPIPQIEQTHQKFTVDERFRFANGISEWEYQIDREDWNKIMVKRAVVFTAHAGFSIANEESLYVLADVAIDYVKKLAVIMKKHFDIQADSPYPDSIDPIDNSLQEIGVKGGVKELIQHYENDVFGRRNKLLKKCQHLKKLIDRQVVNIIKTQNVTPEDLEEEYSTNELEENILSKEVDTITEEEKTEIESGIEEVIIETQYSTDDAIFTDTEIEQINPLYVDNTDIEVKIDTDPKNNENIKINAMDIKDRKINNSRIQDTAKIMEFDLLKPIDSVPTDFNQYGHSDGKEQFTEWKYSCDSESDLDPPKSENILDLGSPKKVMKYLYSPLEVSPRELPLVEPDITVENENDLGLSRMADQLDEDYINYQASMTDENVQTIYIHTMSDTDEAISLNDDNADNTVQIIPVVNENDDSDSNVDYDIVSVHSFL